MDDKIISIRTRKPLAITLAEEKKAEEAYDEQLEEARRKAIEAQLEAIEKLRILAEKGILGVIVMTAQIKGEDNLFFSDLVFGEEGLAAPDAIAYVGQLELLKLEISEIAMMAPVLTSDGDISSPHIAYYEDDLDD